MKKLKPPNIREIGRHKYLAEQERDYWDIFESDATTRKELIDHATLDFLSLVAALSPSRAAARRIVKSVMAEFLDDVLFYWWPRLPRSPTVKHPDDFQPMKPFRKGKNNV